jgi:cytochrome c5
MKHLERIMPGPLLLAAMLIIGTTVVIGQTDSAPPRPQNKTSLKTDQPATPDRGQQVFERNCSRCHSTPEGFSPSISGTVALHMRVRAGLSDADYKALLHFLNP